MAELTIKLTLTLTLTLNVKSTHDRVKMTRKLSEFTFKALHVCLIMSLLTGAASCVSDCFCSMRTGLILVICVGFVQSLVR